MIKSNLKLAGYISLFFIFFLLQNCALPKYEKQPDGVRMVHYHTGYEYRGVSLWDWHFKYKNPRYGQGYGFLSKDPAAVHKKNKGKFVTKVPDNRTYVKPPTIEEWVKLTTPPEKKGGLVEDSTATNTNKNSKQTKEEKKTDDGKVSDPQKVEEVKEQPQQEEPQKEKSKKRKPVKQEGDEEKE